ncbi:PP2C family protein-serine/threonine phosphatase [Massilia luteola]|uniref:PP2C family protein-serine/threonine phosphatase n=1 Tax=Massilia luteola TaxID=3081751 RepID=UPI002ACBDB4D|nr:protein phosphatase 2C domain-containing protein [Massilia sp. Gc5]
MSPWKQLTPSIYHRLAFGSAYGLTDVGLVRQSNEDNFLIDPVLRLVAVADGMGGHDGGEIAACMALETLRDALTAVDPKKSSPGDAADPDATWQDEHMPAIVAVHEAVDAANARVYGANVQDGLGEGGGMGTTLTGFWQSLPDGPLVIFHVGDSRLYRYRDGELAVLTRDQTMYQQALEAGVSGDFPPRNLLLQAIGPTATITPDVKACAPHPGDLYLLCSDGLYGNTPHAAIEQVLAGAHAQSLEHCCADLIALAKTHGSRDNITAVLALVER